MLSLHDRLHVLRVQKTEEINILIDRGRIVFQLGMDQAEKVIIHNRQVFLWQVGEHLPINRDIVDKLVFENFLQNAVEHFHRGRPEEERAEHVFVKHIGLLLEYLNLLDQCVIDHDHAEGRRLYQWLSDCQFLKYFLLLLNFEKGFDVVQHQVEVKVIQCTDWAGTLPF